MNPEKILTQGHTLDPSFTKNGQLNVVYEVNKTGPILIDLRHSIKCQTLMMKFTSI